MGSCTSKFKSFTKEIKFPKRSFQKEIEIFPRKSIEVDYKDTKPFVIPLNTGYVIKVYDGDTITICNRLPIDNCDDIYRFSVRLDGIDTPEMKTKSDYEKKLAIRARDALREKIYNKHIILKGVQTEKYGRILATIYLNNENINEWMIKKGYAVSYDGGKKINWATYV